MSFDDQAMGQLAPSAVELAAAYPSLDLSSGTEITCLQDACEQKVHSCQAHVPQLFNASHFQHLPAVITSAVDGLCFPQFSPPQKLLDDGLATNSIWAALGKSAASSGSAADLSSSSAATASRAGSSLSSMLSGISDASSVGQNDTSTPPSSWPSPRQVLPQQPAACKPPVALPAPSGQGAMLVDASSGRLEWVQPSGPRKAGEGTEPEQQGIVSFTLLPQGGAMMSITLLASGFVIGPSGCSVRELARVTGADIKSWSDSFSSAGGPRPSRTFLLQGPPGSVLTAAEVIAEAVVRYKYLCEGACFGQQVSRMQVVRGMTFVYLPPPRRKVPYAAAIASAPLPRSTAGASNAAPQPRPSTRLNAAAPAWPPPQLQPTLQHKVTLQQPQHILQRKKATAGGRCLDGVPSLRLQQLPSNGSIWSAAAESSGTGWPAAAAMTAGTISQLR